jgi:Fe-S oxidoreductase
MKMWADLFRQGRLKLKKGFHTAAATFQDSCNFIRNAGHFEDSRLLLNHVCTDFREMHPHGNHTYCCGSGGGHGLMAEYKQKRLATAKAKAEAIRATGAGITVVACHNCEDGIRDGLKAHEVPSEVHLFSQYLAEAVDLDGE